jgi:hypothetical protein
MRDYNKEPIKIIDRAVYFQNNIVLFLALGCLYKIFNLEVTPLSLKFYMHYSVDLTIFISSLLLLLLPLFWIIKRKNSPAYFLLENDKINYINVYSNKTTSLNNMIDKFYFVSKDEIIKIGKIFDVDKISFCVISELYNSFGRFHYFTPYELYKKSSIGVHISKVILFLYHTINFILFILPFKIFMLIKSKESLSLLNKNVIVRFKNRNYFLINIYSKHELDEILEYFRNRNIKITNSTAFLAYVQDKSIFVDKNEIWSDDFSDTQIPKDTFKRKLRRFFSLD